MTNRILRNGIETVTCSFDGRSQFALASSLPINSHSYPYNTSDYDLAGELFTAISEDEVKAIASRHIDKEPVNLPFETNGFFTVSEYDSLMSALYHLTWHTFHVDSSIWEKFRESAIAIGVRVQLSQTGQSRNCNFLTRHPSTKKPLIVGWENYPECYLMSLPQNCQIWQNGVLLGLL